MKLYIAILLLVSAVLNCGIVLAGDTTEDRTKAAERYLSVMPMKSLMDDTITEMAKQVPAEKRKLFTELMNQFINIEELEKITKKAMIKVFTAEELNALADFYGSKIGKSAMKKFGVYMAEVMPYIQNEMMQAGQKAAKSI